MNQKINSSIKFRDGKTPLHIVCEHGNQQAALWLVVNSAHIDARDREGHTPLHLACRGNHYYTAKVLAENRADYTILNNVGQTPLDYQVPNIRAIAAMFGY
jgi:ankyrin repeat protein